MKIFIRRISLDGLFGDAYDLAFFNCVVDKWGAANYSGQSFCKSSMRCEKLSFWWEILRNFNCILQLINRGRRQSLSISTIEQTNYGNLIKFIHKINIILKSHNTQIHLKLSSTSEVPPRDRKDSPIASIRFWFCHFCSKCSSRRCKGILGGRRHTVGASVWGQCACAVTTCRFRGCRIVRACVHWGMAWRFEKSCQMPSCCSQRGWHWFSSASRSTRWNQNEIPVVWKQPPIVLTTISWMIFLATEGVTCNAWFTVRPSKSKIPTPPNTWDCGSKHPISSTSNVALKISLIGIFDGRHFFILNTIIRRPCWSRYGVTATISFSPSFVKCIG